MPAKLRHPLPSSGGSFADEALPPLLDPLIEGADVHAGRCACGMSHIGVVVAPFAGVELIQRSLRLLHPARLPVQQPNGLCGDQHQPGRAPTINHIDKG